MSELERAAMWMFIAMLAVLLIPPFIYNCVYAVVSAYCRALNDEINRNQKIAVDNMRQYLDVMAKKENK